jgi:hypothetical protein
MGMQFEIGVALEGFFWIVWFPDECDFVSPLVQVAVEAVFGDIEFSTSKPTHGRFFKIPFQSFRPGVAPLILPGYLVPEKFGLIYATLVSCVIIFFGFDLKVHLKVNW